MSKKKLSSLEDLGGFVFSTNTNFEYEKEEKTETLAPKKQFLEAHFSNKGRGGKGPLFTAADGTAAGTAEFRLGRFHCA